jgi:hypothetical protein
MNCLTSDETGGNTTLDHSRCEVIYLTEPLKLFQSLIVRDDEDSWETYNPRIPRQTSFSASKSDIYEGP